LENRSEKQKTLLKGAAGTRSLSKESDWKKKGREFSGEKKKKFICFPKKKRGGRRRPGGHGVVTEGRNQKKPGIHLPDVRRVETSN